MARSLATATVRPRGSKLAWATQLASMAPLALLLAAVMTYSPPDTRARDLATSGAMLAFIFAMDSFLVRTCARRVPASSIPCKQARASNGKPGCNEQQVAVGEACYGLLQSLVRCSRGPREGPRNVSQQCMLQLSLADMPKTHNALMSRSGSCVSLMHPAFGLNKCHQIMMCKGIMCMYVPGRWLHWGSLSL